MRTIFRCWFLSFLIALITLGYTQTVCAAGRPGSSLGEWRLIGLNAEQQHFSPLKQIDAQNVGRLGLAWAVDMPSADGLVGVPLVADDIVYQSGPLGHVYANDVHTGRLLWTFDAHIPLPGGNLVSAWGNRVNRGLALWQDKVYIGTGDCRVIAIDRNRGTKVWEAQSCDPAQGYTITGAPRIGGGKLFMGNANSDLGVTRGFVDAFDAASGKHLWRFYTVPGDPTRGFENDAMKMAAGTWDHDYWSKFKGGGSVWDAMTFDPMTNLLYIGTDGAMPMNPRARSEDAGDELFTTSIVALNADTGEYVWHYQTTPHDAWNYDATMHIMIADLRIRGAQRRVVMQAPKNGFFYVLDAKTGRLLSARNIVPVNWASGINMKTGRPIELPAARWYEHPDKPTKISPSTLGAHSWQPMSYSPITGLVYIPAMEQPMEVVGRSDKTGGLDTWDLEVNWYTGQQDPKQFKGTLIAWDPIAQRAKWRHDLGFPQNGGVLSTAGNVVFQGTSSGVLNAYHAVTGALLWSRNTDSGIYAAPITVEIDGEQLILVPTGSGTSSGILEYPRIGGKTRGPSRLLAFKLDGNAVLPVSTIGPEHFPMPSLPRPSGQLVARGRRVWNAAWCEVCHGYDAIGAQGSSVPDLRKSAAVTANMTADTFAAIVLGGTLGPKGMPSFQDSIAPADLPALRAFIVGQAWKAYGAQEADAEVVR